MTKTIYVNSLFNSVVETTEEFFESYLDDYADKEGKITIIPYSNSEMYVYNDGCKAVTIATVVYTK